MILDYNTSFLYTLVPVPPKDLLCMRVLCPPGRTEAAFSPPLPMMLSEVEGAIMALSVPAACQEREGLGKAAVWGGLLCWSPFNKSHFNVLLWFAFLGETQPELNWLHFPGPQVTVARWDLGDTNHPGQCRGQRSSFTNPPFSAQYIGLILPTEPLGTVANTMDVGLLSKYWAAGKCPCPKDQLQLP